MDELIRTRLHAAIEKFNSQEYFDCHEILEDIWFDTHDDSKDFYQGLLHIAVGLYHLTVKNNLKGMNLQFGKAFAKLKEYPEQYNGIELEKLLEQVRAISKDPAKAELLAGSCKIELV